MFQNEVTAPVQPNAEGEYSSDEITQRSRQGFPTAGLKIKKPMIGVQGGPVSAAQPANVGIQNPYSQAAPRAALPEQFKEYTPSEAKQFSIPQGWGQGEVSVGGKTMFAYSTPEEKSREAARAAHLSDTAEHDAHQKMFAAAHNQLMHLASGSGNPYDGMTDDQRNGAMQALAQHLGAMTAGDAQLHATKGQHYNPLQNPEYAAAQINHLNAQAERERAEGAAADPMATMNAMAANPDAAELAMAFKSGDPAQWSQAMANRQSRGQQSARPPGLISQQNLEQALHADKNQSLAAILGDEGSDFDTKIAKAGPFLGAEDPQGTNRGIVNAWLKREYADRPDDWQQQYYSPPKPIGNPVADFATSLGAKLINTPLNYLFGAGNPHGTQTGLFNQQKAYETAQRRIGLLLKHNLSPK